VKCRYLHSEVNADRSRFWPICGSAIDVLIGINLLAKDWTSEVSLVAILDAIRRIFAQQHIADTTIGRCPRTSGPCDLYATGGPIR